MEKRMHTPTRKTRSSLHHESMITFLYMQQLPVVAHIRNVFFFPSFAVLFFNHTVVSMEFFEAFFFLILVIIGRGAVEM